MISYRLRACGLPLGPNVRSRLLAVYGTAGLLDADKHASPCPMAPGMWTTVGCQST